jgi:hypothetical protein
MVAYKSHILRTSWLGFGSEVSRSDGHESSTVFVEMLSETRENDYCDALGGIPSPRSFTVVMWKKILLPLQDNNVSYNLALRKAKSQGLMSSESRRTRWFFLWNLRFQVQTNQISPVQ